LSLGTYPDTGLKAAREQRDESRRLLAAGTDPGEYRKAQKVDQEERAANSFESVAREWFASRLWVDSYRVKVLSWLEMDICPWAGARPLSVVTAPEMLACLRWVVLRGAHESAHRILQNCSQIFRYAIATGRAGRDVAADLRGALAPAPEQHRAAMTEPSAFAGLLRAIDSYQGSLPTRCALQLAPLTFVRPGELRNAEWSEFDLASAQWNIPAAKMKMREAHLVPLSQQAIRILQELKPLTGDGRYVFPSARGGGKPMSDNAVLAALRRMGFGKDEMSGHGFRATARTILDEVLNVRPDFIEHQLAHAVRDPNGRAYNRTAHLAERKVMMQRWADYLDAIKIANQP
jgi:integrase